MEVAHPPEQSLPHMILDGEGSPRETVHRAVPNSPGALAFERLISMAYRAAGGTESWESLLRELAAYTGMTAAWLWIVEPDGSLLVFECDGSALGREWAARSIASGRVIVPDTCARWFIGSGESWSASIGWVEGKLPEFVHDASRFDRERLGAHLARALKIHLQLRSQLRTPKERNRSPRSWLDEIAEPLFVVDAGCMLVLHNQAAGALLVSRTFRVIGGCLTARHHRDQIRLMAFVAGMKNRVATACAGRRDPGSMLRLGSPSDPPMTLFADLLDDDGVNAWVGPADIRSFNLTRRSCVLLTVHDSSLPSRPTVAAVVEAFGLTRAEARAAVLVYYGKSAEEIADEFNIGMNTIRSQIKSMFAKLGARKQADVVRMLKTLPNVRAVRALPSEAVPR